MSRRLGQALGGADALKLTDVALRAKVSASTASRVLNGRQDLVSARTYQRVLRVIEELGYAPAALGRALRQGQSNLVALLLPDIQNPFYSAIASSIEQCLQRDGISLVLCNIGEDPSAQDDALRQARGFLSRSIVLLGAVDSPVLRDLARQGVSMVFVNRRPPTGVKGIFIGIDNQQAGRDAATHLYAHGARRFGMIHGPMHSSATRERYEGFAEQLGRLGCKLQPSLVWAGELSIQCGWTLGEAVHRNTHRLDAVFCGNDLIAYGLRCRLIELGLRVPEDLALVGFDDTPLNRWLAPWLSSVRVPYERIGEEVRRLLREGAAHVQADIVLPHLVIERGGPESTPAARRGKP